MLGEMVSNGPEHCSQCGGFIAPGDQTVDGMHPECVRGRREDTTTGVVWGAWVAGLTLFALALGAIVWGWL